MVAPSRLILIACALCWGALVGAEEVLPSAPVAKIPKTPRFYAEEALEQTTGELVTADFVHRAGQLRRTSGELIDFVLLPSGSVHYLHSEADLRDVRIGTHLLASSVRGSAGVVLQVTSLEDQFSTDARQGLSYRVEEVRAAEGKLAVSRHLAGQPGEPRELLVNASTHTWKNGKLTPLGDLAAGDELLFDTAGQDDLCLEIWVGPEAQKQATEQQQQKFAASLKWRGLPGWIEQTKGLAITFTPFSGAPTLFAQQWMSNFAVGKPLRIVVANSELRTWNPPVDNEQAILQEIQTPPIEGAGSSGVRLTFTVRHMLEGFRRGHVARIFAENWPLNDQPFGESLMGYGYDRLKSTELLENPAREYSQQFPFRTDFGNEQLPWYQLQAGQALPRFSEHRVLGQLVSVDAEKRTGEFLLDRSGELVHFALLPGGVVQSLGQDATLGDLPVGGRCRFHLYQDTTGAFTQAQMVADEFSFLASNIISYRIEELRLEQGALAVARRIPQIKNVNGDMEQPPDIGRCLLLVDPATRVWRGTENVSLSTLAVGDLLLANVTGALPNQPSRCTDLWVGEETQKLVRERNKKLTQK